MSKPCAPRGIVCSYRNCEICGWNPEIEAERKARIRAGEMKINAFGLTYCPIIRNDGGTGVDTENAD